MTNSEMIRNEILSMVREAGVTINKSTDPNSPPSWWGCGHNDSWERFADLVVAKEREECKKACEQVYAEGLDFDEITIEHCIAAILERNNQ